MFDVAPNAENGEPTPTTHSIKVLLYDFHSGEMVSSPHRPPALLTDQQPLNENGLPGIPSEERARRFGVRNGVVIPPLDFLGVARTPDNTTSAFVMSTERPIEHSTYRGFRVKRVPIVDAIHTAHSSSEFLDASRMDLTDAQLIISSLAINDVRTRIPRSYRLS